MSYNGVGLTTPRGTGTNGYVQRNLSSIPAHRRMQNQQQQSFGRPMDFAAPAPIAAKKPNQAILEHDRKRQLELAVVEYEEKLQARKYAFVCEPSSHVCLTLRARTGSYSPEEIEKMVKE